MFDTLISGTLATLGNKSTVPVRVSHRQEAIDLFSSGNSPFFRFGSGFWAQDPAGDISMMLTPGLHKQLRYLARDAKIRAAVEPIRGGDASSGMADAFQRLNFALIDSGLIAVVRHFGFVYGFNPPVESARLPLAMQLPYPWQLFTPYVQP
ncbi:MAG: hypothetical protein HC883_06425 [Bdellovibrionaceae bacterium]|nr:hypothetical protein [Pseudobdellovibrionaceae bacterium]